MDDLISRQAAIEVVNELTYPSSLTDVKIVLANLPSTEAIPVSWIEGRIINAEDAGQDVLARMWRELINGYRREHGYKTSD